MKFSAYYLMMKERPDRASIKEEWVQKAFKDPIREFKQLDGRIRRWALISEADNRYLRIVVLEDGETVHNAFFDRGFKP